MILIFSWFINSCIALYQSNKSPKKNTKFSVDSWPSFPWDIPFSRSPKEWSLTWMWNFIGY